MQVRAHAIPGFDTALVRAHVLRCAQGDSVDLCIDAAGLALGPLHRGRGRAYLVRDVAGTALRITEQAEQREGFLPAIGAHSHLARWRAAHTQRRALAITGQGNLGINKGVLAATANGVVGVQGAWNGALHVHADGSVSALTLDAAVEVGSVLHAPTEGFVLTGPLLLRAGKAVAPETSVYADPRHLLRFAWVQTATGERVDFGHDELLADPQRYEAAVHGVPQEFSLHVQLPADARFDAPLVSVAVDAANLRRDLAWKGYHECAHATVPGEFSILGNDARLVFLPGLYPHHVLAADEGGRLLDIVISGLSNRAGVTVYELARDLESAGVREAILLDNGGDVGLFDATTEIWRVQPAEPDRAQCWPLTASLIHHGPAA